MNKKQIGIANKIHQLALEVFKTYNSVVRTPVNWQEERQRLRDHPNSRAVWKYKVPSGVKKLQKQIIELESDFDKAEGEKSAGNIYQTFLPDVVGATVQTVLARCQILEDLKNGSFKTTLELRKQFYGLKYDYSDIETAFSKLLNNLDIKKTGEKFGKQTISADEAAAIIKDLIKNVRNKIEEVIPFPSQYREQILEAFNVEVDVVNDPSFRMRCITDPETLTTKVLLNKNLRYSLSYLKIAYLHEFCGHALEMAVFDKTLVKNKVVPEIYSYAGVFSPNIFDVKAEVFADRIVSPFVEKDEEKYIKYRRDVWLICRAMADYLYNFRGKTIKDVMQVYKSVGLEDFAFDEAIMAAIFIDGYQGMYLFANQKIEKLQRKSNLSNKGLLTRLLYMGKVPINKFQEFQQLFDLECLV